MTRTTPRPVSTAPQTLQPLQRYCPSCGETMWAASHNYRTLTTLEAVLALTLHIRRCLNRGCPHSFVTPTALNKKGALTSQARMWARRYRHHWAVALR